MTAVVEVHAFTAFGGARCTLRAVDISQDALSQLVAEVYSFEAQLSRFLPSSELSRFNRRAGQRVSVSPLLEELLRVALEAHTLSDGLVNAASLHAVVAAGYDRTIEEVRRRQGVRAPDTSSPVRPLLEVLEVGDGWARLAPGAAIDLGGVGKGWLADQLAERLENGVMNLGGDLRARGAGPDDAGWSVRLCDGSAVLLRDVGAATSGTSVRRWDGGHHLIDVRTGRPALTEVAAISVVAGCAVDAEVLAKGAAICGVHAGAPWARARGALRVAVVANVAGRAGSVADTRPVRA